MSSVWKRIARPIARRVLGSRFARALALRAADADETAFWRARAIAQFVRGGAGSEIGVDAQERRRMAAQFEGILRAVESGTTLPVHLALADAILSLPAAVPGDVVECGAWKGASSAALSLVCARSGRRLKVCDSFQGLPDDGERRHTGMHTGVYGHYRVGMFAGSLDEVRANIAAHGRLDACDFVQGFFNESLGALRGPVALAFLDVDLESSMRDCLRALWPLLNEGAYVYTDDAGDLDVVRVFFDHAWWREELGCDAPGFVGSGCGLPLGPRHSALGYTRKCTEFDAKAWRRVPFLHYPD